MCPVLAAKNLKYVPLNRCRHFISYHLLIRLIRAIFIRLLTCQILLGHFPSPLLLDHFNLHAQFGPLLQAIKWGDRALYYQHFNRWSEWFRQRGLWLVLREKGEVLVWRSLFRHAWVLHAWSLYHSHADVQSNPISDTGYTGKRIRRTLQQEASHARHRLSWRRCGSPSNNAERRMSIFVM